MKAIIESNTRNISAAGRSNSYAKFALKALAAAIALGFAQAAAADVINASGNISQLPTGGNATSGTVTGGVSANQLNVNVETSRAVVDWQTFNIGTGYTVNFTQTSPSSSVLNRVTADANPSQILGSMNGSGMNIMLMNPNGIMFGSNAIVNVGALIATTGAVDESRFVNTGVVGISGAAGSISNAGQITAENAGLVALVAPSVTNSGVITATGGTIALAGATAATISMNGSLYEFALTGATAANISNALGATLNGATLYLSTGDAANLLSGTINLEGIQMATSAIIVDGDKVVLKSDLNAPAVSGHSNNIDVYSSAHIQDAVDIAKTGTPAAGAVIDVYPGDYSETAMGRDIGIPGSYNLGLFVNKDNLTIRGVNALAVPITNANDVGAWVTSGTSTNFGMNHGVMADNVTIEGLGFKPDVLNPNKTIEIAGDNFTFRNSVVDNRSVLDGAGALYFGELIAGPTGEITRLNVSGSWFYDGSVVLTNGVGVAADGVTYQPAADRVISSNAFIGSSNYRFGGLLFNGKMDEIPWRLLPIGAGTVTGNSFSGFDDSVLVRGEQQGVDLGQLMHDNSFDRSVLVTDAGGNVRGELYASATTMRPKYSIQSNIQSGINRAVSGDTVNVGAGSYTESLTIAKALSLDGTSGSKIVVADNTNGISINANDVTISDLELAGPVSSPYLTYGWGSNISRGIVVGNGYTGFTIRNNNIHDVRNGILIDGRNTGSVTGNRIENTKSGISVQYTDGAGIAISGNSEGPIGNEWGINLHLNGFLDGGTIYANPHMTAPTPAQQQGLLDLSNANGGWAVQDQGYASSNRTQIAVSTSGSASAQGSQLTPLNSIQGGINAVVSGGKVNVAAGTYAENLTISKALTLTGAGKGVAIVDPLSGDAVNVSGNIGASASVVIDGFTFRDAPRYGVNVAGSTTLGELTIQNSEFLSNGRNGFIVSGSSTTGAAGLAKVSLLNDVFVGNGTLNPASLGYGDILFNYYNGDVSLKDLQITGSGEYIGIQMRGASPTANSPQNAGTVVFDNVTIDGSFLRPDAVNTRAPYFNVGTWNPGGPGDAIHLLEYASVANVSFNNVAINTTVGHGMFVEGLGSTLNIGNTTFGAPNTLITGSGVSPTISRNIFVGANDNTLVTKVDATAATFSGAADGFAIEDRVLHALDVSGLGLVTWNPGNFYVTQASGSVQRGIDAASTGNIVNVQSGVYAEHVVVNDLRNLSFNGSAVDSLTINAGGSGIGGNVIADTLAGFEFNAPVVLQRDTVLDTSAAGGNVTLGSIDGTTAGGQAFTVRAGTGAVELGDLGAVNRLGATAVSGDAIRLNGSSYTANSLEFNAPIVLLNDTVLDTSAAGGNVMLGSIDGISAGGQAFTIRAGTGDVNLGDLGAVNRLGATAVSGDAIRLNGSTYMANSLEFNGKVALTQPRTTFTTNGGNIVLDGDIQNADANPHDLYLIAGSGSTRGNVNLVSGGSANRPLGELNVVSNNFTLDSTLWVGRYRIDARGSVALSNHTLIGLDLGVVNTIDAGGTTTGTTISPSPIHIDAESVNVHVEAPAVQISSVGAATVSGSAETLVLNAPSGSVNGNFDYVENLGTGVIDINGRPQVPSTLSSNTDSNHIVASNIAGGTAAATEGGGLATELSAKGEKKAKTVQKGRVQTVRDAPSRAGELLARGLRVELDLTPGNRSK